MWLGGLQKVYQICHKAWQGLDMAWNLYLKASLCTQPHFLWNILYTASFLLEGSLHSPFSFGRFFAQLPFLWKVPYTAPFFLECSLHSPILKMYLVIILGYRS